MVVHKKNDMARYNHLISQPNYINSIYFIIMLSYEMRMTVRDIHFVPDYVFLHCNRVLLH